MSTHEDYMHRAIGLAKLAEGCTSPNPLVGCVVVKDNVVVGRGWHSAAGQAHAEAVALQHANVQSHGATLYVTLEPCCHHGRTPPCTDAIIAAGIKKVVYATADTNTRAGGGATLLQQAGIETVHGVLQEQARYLNRFYFHHLHSGTPYVVAKFAASLDGRIATRTLNSQWITGQLARARGHHLRQAVDAIIVGAQTVINDDPQLTVRHTDLSESLSVDGQNVRHPLRVVLDSSGRVPLQSRIFCADLPGQTIVATTTLMPDHHARQLQAQGVEVLTLDTTEESQIDVNKLLQALGKRNIQSLMVEGGPTVLGSFLDAQQVHEVWAFLAPCLIGGREAPAAIGGLGIDQLYSAARLDAMRIEQIGDDLLVRGQLGFATI